MEGNLRKFWICVHSARNDEHKNVFIKCKTRKIKKTIAKGKRLSFFYRKKITILIIPNTLAEKIFFLSFIFS